MEDFSEEESFWRFIREVFTEDQFHLEDSPGIRCSRCEKKMRKINQHFISTDHMI